ncbi:MAG: hypothetical protein N3G18_05590 [Candidatus Saccharicenans sp.]|nr:hypothetical protein [Candidatus Saccharicenans sp.]
MNPEVIMVNRAPVLTLWAAVVAERLGFDRDEALSLGKALAGLNAQSKGRSLGIFKPVEHRKELAEKKARPGEEFWIELLGRPIPARITDHGLRAVIKGRPIEPDGVSRYLQEKFGPRLESVKEAMLALARAFKAEELASKAYSLYEQFRPEIPPGLKGWGAKGELKLDLIRRLSRQSQS